LGVGVFVAVVCAPGFQRLDHLLGGLARVAADFVQGCADVACHLAIDPALFDREVADDQHRDVERVNRLAWFCTDSWL